MLLTYDILMKLPSKAIQEQYQLEKHTACDWFRCCREEVSRFVRSESEMIGGVGKVIEVDESKFGRRKYRRSRYVKGQWVFGGVERGSGRTFLETVNDRSAETLIELIKKWIRPGTTLVTDCWAAYRSLPDEGFNHLRVNQGSSTRGPRATCGPRSPLPSPAGRFEKITTNASPARCLHII
jgi:transposase-like protein